MLDLDVILFTALIVLSVICAAGGIALFRRPRRSGEKPVLHDELWQSLREQQDFLATLVGQIRPEETPEHARFRTRMGSLSLHAPRSAIIKAWRDLDDATFKKLHETHLPAEPEVRFADLPRLVRDKEVFTECELDLYLALRRTRDLSFSFPNDQINSDVAATFLDGVEFLLHRIHSARAEPQTADVPALNPAISAA